MGSLDTEDPRAWRVQTRSTPHIYKFPSIIIYIHTHYFPLNSCKNFVKQTDWYHYICFYQNIQGFGGITALAKASWLLNGKPGSGLLMNSTPATSLSCLSNQEELRVKSCYKVLTFEDAPLRKQKRNV